MAHEPTAALIERFKPTGGRLVGIVGLVLLVLLAVAILGNGFDVGAAFALAVLVLLAVVVVAALIRPGVIAYDDHLLFRNAWTDVRIAWHGIEEVDVRQTIRARVDGRTYHGVAVGKSTRQLLKANVGRETARANMFGGSRHDSLSDQATLTGMHVTAMSYADYVVVKLQGYAAAQAPASRERDPVVRTWTWATIVPAAVLLAVAVALAVVLALRA